ncbi:MAG: 2-phospho-L-lactate guanylyltransferase [Chloroflexi bacterium]|nr:2-phospho-L-lactate guanylyltransferase [Chloroflexota bacterium]
MDQFSILIPMKVPSEGKSRLIDVLTRSSRKLLTIALLKRVLKASIGSCADSVYVIGGGLEVAQVCQQMGVNWLDSNSGDLNFDVSLGIAEINKTGNGTVYLPGDLPFVTPSDIDSVIKLSDNGNFAVFVSSESDGGTNCILFPNRTDLIPLLGFDSYRKHYDYAEDRGILFETIRPEGLLIDLDTPEDLRKCEEIENGFLKNIGIV